MFTRDPCLRREGGESCQSSPNRTKCQLSVFLLSPASGHGFPRKGVTPVTWISAAEAGPEGANSWRHSADHSLGCWTASPSQKGDLDNTS